MKHDINDRLSQVLDVRCLPRDGFTSSACDHFDIVPRREETDHDMFRGAVVLKKALDYRDRQIFRVPISVNDGRHTVRLLVVITVLSLHTITID